MVCGGVLQITIFLVVLQMVVGGFGRQRVANRQNIKKEKTYRGCVDCRS